MTIKHLHHIIPKHNGGTDEIVNLVSLSIEDHANAHKDLYETFGRWEDYVAWQGLSGMIPHADIIRMVQSEAAKIRNLKYGNSWTGIRTSHNFATNVTHQNDVTIRANSIAARAKRKMTFEKIEHQQGEKNSQFGKHWYTNGVLKIKCLFGDCPDGWITTAEYRESQKHKSSPNYKKHWYNDDMRNYLCIDSDIKIKELNLKRGRLNCTFKKTA